MLGYKIHHSHDALDVSDVTYFHDYICGYCKKSDEELVDPCDKNPHWDVII